MERGSSFTKWEMCGSQSQPEYVGAEGISTLAGGEI
jgi:hypothetical protein